MLLKDKVYYNLEKFFGYKTFRTGQYNIIMNILSEKDVFCIMPTGAGKSICYQLPALVFDGITIVISPLISLMKDQVDSLNDIGINAAYINSTQDNNEINKILEDANAGFYKLIYIAPERLENKEFIYMINSLNISQIAIDEAHCVSEWGHDFRKSYRFIKPFVNRLKRRPIISAFTGTATDEVKEDTINLLGLIKPYIFIGDINRENLSINVLKEEDKSERIRNIIDKHKDESGIIYCLSRKEVDELSMYLKNCGYEISTYHGGMNDKDKEREQEDFLFERTNLMVATNAFGMGIDKSNIRYIIHCTMPKNLESYYQEIGRGGRDGLDCDCYLLFNRSDINRVEFIINKSSNINSRQIALRKLQSIIDFCEEDKCYRSNLLRYFDKNYSKEYCSNCSNCLKNEELKNYTKEAQMILSTVYRTREKYGISVIVDVLRGIRGPKIIENKLDKITTFGIMKQYSNTFIKSLIKEMLRSNLVCLKDGTYSMLKLNQSSMDILLQNKKVILFVKEEQILDKDLFIKLKEWRRNRASKEGIKPYIIFSDSSLIEIANNLPKNEEELIQIRGVGEKKVLKYGKEILQIINSKD